MRRLFSYAASALALTAVTSCEDEDRSTHFHDISIESTKSIWLISGFDYWGTEMGDEMAFDLNDTVYYMSFNGDGTGVAYWYQRNYYDKETFDSVSFRYKTDDACHFDITSEKGTQKLTFAKKSYLSGGRRESACVIYRTDESSGREIYRLRECEEMRTDTALGRLCNGKMKRRLTVPKERVWAGKSIVGEFSHSYGNVQKYERLEFHNDGRFIFNKGNHELSHRPERRGDYRITVGEKDSIFFKFDNGQEDEAYHIIFDWNGRYLYKDGELAIHLLTTHSDCGY